MPASDIFTLDEFKASRAGHFTSGTWVVEYHDKTHLPQGTYIPLGKVEVEGHTPRGDALFRFRPRPRKSLACSQTSDTREQEGELSLSAAWAQDTGGNRKTAPERAARVIYDQLEESMVRLGLTRPVFEINGPTFSKRKFAIVVLDTSALRDGVVRHLREQFPETQLWIIIPTISLMEIGERVAYMTSQARGTQWGPPKHALIRFRPQVTIAPQQVIWVKQNFPTETLELAPELLRAFRGYDVNRSTDQAPDRLSINDRLILEGIKDLCRQRGLSESVYLVSSDKDMSRLARLEGIHTIYPAAPSFQEFPDGIYCVRYAVEARAYIYCSVHRFLWDLAHVFSKVRMRCVSGQEAKRVVELFYYYPAKLVNDWIDDRLEVTDLGSDSSAEAT